MVKNPSFDKDLNEWLVPENSWWSQNAGKLGSGAAVIQAIKPPNDKYIHETSIEQCVQLSGNGDHGFSVDLRLEGLPIKKAR